MACAVCSSAERTGIGANDEAGIVGQVASQAVGSGLEVALVSRQVHHGDDLHNACSCETCTCCNVIIVLEDLYAS